MSVTNTERKVLTTRIDDDVLQTQWTLRQGKSVVDGANVYDVDETPSALVDFTGVTTAELQTLALGTLKITGLRQDAIDRVALGDDVEDFAFNVREFLDTAPAPRTRTAKKVTLADIEKGVASGEFTKDDVRALLASM